MRSPTIVTEAASQGTPAVVYDVDGLRDSVRGGQTGTVVSENSPATLVQSIVRVLDDEKVYSRQRVAAWQWSKSINFDESYHGIMKAVDA